MCGIAPWREEIISKTDTHLKVTLCNIGPSLTSCLFLATRLKNINMRRSVGKNIFLVED